MNIGLIRLNVIFARASRPAVAALSLCLLLVSSAWAEPQASPAKTARPDSGEKQIGPMGNPAMMAMMAAARWGTESEAPAVCGSAGRRRDDRGLHQAAPQGQPALRRDFADGPEPRHHGGHRHRPRHRRAAAAGRNELGFGDDWIWQFRKVDDRIQIVRRNVRFRPPAACPEVVGRSTWPIPTASSSVCRS